jgi:hypothetical protein
MNRRGAGAVVLFRADKLGIDEGRIAIDEAFEQFRVEPFQQIAT